MFEIGESRDAQLLMAMARCDGETLKDVIRRGPMPLDQAMDIVRQVAAGPAKAHAEGIVHRDIKPANIFVNRDDLELGTELAVRESIPLVLAGRVHTLGGRIIIATQLTRPATGEVVSATRVQTAGEAALLPAFDEPLAKVTTSSLDALGLYCAGDRAFLDGDWNQAIMVLEPAVAADSTCAMAYSPMAHGRRDRLTPRERLDVEGEYARYRGQYDSAIQSMTSLLQRHPDDGETRANLTATCLWTVQYDKALQNLLESQGRHPVTWQHAPALGNAYGFLGRFDDAVGAFRRAQAINPAPLRTRMFIAWCCICAGDHAAAAVALDSLSRMTATGSVGVGYQWRRACPPSGASPRRWRTWTVRQPRRIARVLRGRNTGSTSTWACARCCMVN